jgi:predicted DNA-binding transcriptional regulator
MSKKLPPDYFKNLKAEIFDKIENLDDDLASNAPILSGMNRKNSYKVPEYYFSELRSKILRRASVGKTRWIQLRRIAVAASISLVLAWSFNHLVISDHSSELAQNEILDYYLYNIEDVDMEWVGAIYEDSEPESTFQNFNDEELELYLSSVVDELSLNTLYANEEL